MKFSNYMHHNQDTEQFLHFTNFPDISVELISFSEPWQPLFVAIIWLFENVIQMKSLSMFAFVFSHLA